MPVTIRPYGPGGRITSFSLTSEVVRRIDAKIKNALQKSLEVKSKNIFILYCVQGRYMYYYQVLCIC